MTHIHHEVNQSIDYKIVEEMTQFANQNDVNVWGMCQPRNFMKDMVYLLLYRDG